ncbi:hypothetical protein MLD38_012862 [Melastoma candidum]|uniref:Uncharacterized protein n=1 Tax=Melastoma candidum TaxID=119954 RepID=A0ACB9R748_9MYRT|nr:hypothetical protein MLD38_012862 [Melastoma candidum]
MDRSPGGVGCGCLNPSPASPLFTPDEIEVATALAGLKFLIPFRDPGYFDFLTPLWGSKRPRSACVSAVAPSPPCLPPVRPGVIACLVGSGGGNLRDISPDSPLLLKDSPLSSVDGQGSSGIAADPSREKKAMKKRGCEDAVDVSEGIKISKKKPKKEKMGPRNNAEEEVTESVDLGLALRGQTGCQLPGSQMTSDPSSASNTLPSGGACSASPSPEHASSPVLPFDLNIVPPDCPGTQSPLPDERDGEQGLRMSDVVAEDSGSTKAARQRRLAIRREQISKARGNGSRKLHAASRR